MVSWIMYLWYHTPLCFCEDRWLTPKSPSSLSLSLSHTHTHTHTHTHRGTYTYLESIKKGSQSQTNTDVYKEKKSESDRQTERERERETLCENTQNQCLCSTLPGPKPQRPRASHDCLHPAVGNLLVGECYTDSHCWRISHVVFDCVAKSC